METMEIIEERITFANGELKLDGVLTYPQTAEPDRAILLCSPHPHFAGNMDNNIIRELAQYLASDSITLRFDYRGVGDSRIDLPVDLSVFDYWNDIEDSKNFDDAVSDIACAADELCRITGDLPLTVIGYSFGVVTGFLYGNDNSFVDKMIGVAPPLGKVSFGFLNGCDKEVLVLIGKGDFLYSDRKASEFEKAIGPCAEIELLDNCDHFFRGDERHIAAKVKDFICNSKE